MSNIGNNRGPFSISYNTVRHKDKTISTIVNDPLFDTMVGDLENAYDYEVGYVPAGYENRPDLISNVFYGTPINWWLLMLVNNITDPSEGFTQNQRILIPKI